MPLGHIIDRRRCGDRLRNRASANNGRSLRTERADKGMSLSEVRDRGVRRPGLRNALRGRRRGRGRGRPNGNKAEMKLALESVSIGKGGREGQSGQGKKRLFHVGLSLEFMDEL